MTRFWLPPVGVDGAPVGRWGYWNIRLWMGGLVFMVEDKMCVGIVAELLMVRLDPAIYEESLTKPGCMAMEFTGRPMRGFVLVSPEAIGKKSAFAYWVKLALEFNPRAVASRKGKRKTPAKKKGRPNHGSEKRR